MKQSGMYPERVEKINPKTNSKEIDNTVYSENVVNRKFDIDGTLLDFRKETKRCFSRC